MVFELNRQRGISLATGIERDLNQCQIRVGGKLVGYLPFGKTSQVQVTISVQFPYDALTAEEIASLEMQLETIQGYPAKVQPPEQVSRSFVEAALKAVQQAKDEEDDE
jgi:hypothetical protein